MPIRAFRLGDRGGWSDVYEALCCLLGKHGKDFILYQDYEEMKKRQGSKSLFRGEN